MKTEDLEVFKLSHEVVLDTYKLTRDYPNEERFGLVSQMRRSSASIPMNIMEGSGRRGTKEFIHFLSIASGSCEELKYQFLLSKDLNYIETGVYEKLLEKCLSVSRMLYKLIESLEKRET